MVWVVTGRALWCLMDPKFRSTLLIWAFSCFLKKSSFDPFCPVVAVARPPDVIWIGLCSLDTRFPYRSETVAVFCLPEVHTTVPQKCQIYGEDPLTRRALSGRSVPFVVDTQLLVKDARAGISDPNGTLRAGLVAISTAMSSFRILKMAMMTNGTLLMCFWIFTPTFMPGFVDTLMPFMNCPARSVLPYLRMLEESSVWLCKT